MAHSSQIWTPFYLRHREWDFFSRGNKFQDIPLGAFSQTGLPTSSDRTTAGESGPRSIRGRRAEVWSVPVAESISPACIAKTLATGLFSWWRRRGHVRNCARWFYSELCGCRHVYGFTGRRHGRSRYLETTSAHSRTISWTGKQKEGKYGREIFSASRRTFKLGPRLQRPPKVRSICCMRKTTIAFQSRLHGRPYKSL